MVGAGRAERIDRPHRGTALCHEILASLLEKLAVFGAVIAFALVISFALFRIIRLTRGEPELSPARRAALAKLEAAGLKILHVSEASLLASGKYAGIAFRYRVVPPYKNMPGRTRISIALRSAGEIHVYPESGFTEGAKQMGFAKEFQTGDASFDRRFYFSGSSDAYVSEAFGDAQRLQRLRTLFAAGFDELKKSASELYAERPKDELIESAELHHVVGQLAAFDFPPPAGAQAGGHFGGSRPLNILRGFMLVICLAGFAGFFTADSRLGRMEDLVSGLFQHTFLLSALILVAAVYVLKGSSMGARGIVEVSLLLPVGWMLLYGVLLPVNQCFDTSQAEVHEVRLLKHYRGSSRGGTRTGFLEFESWRGSRHEEVRVDLVTLAGARQGQVWQLRVRPGFLGQPWLESAHPMR